MRKRTLAHAFVPQGGRKKLADKDASLLSDLDALVKPTSRGDPMSPLRWTCTSTHRLAVEIKAKAMTKVRIKRRISIRLTANVALNKKEVCIDVRAMGFYSGRSLMLYTTWLAQMSISLPDAAA